jgi:peptidoglycan/xylan/chitin deacetylase (PgdA/CDA1 family)
MKYRLALICLSSVALTFSGCNKIQKLLHRGTPQQVAAAQPTATPTPAATATPAPEAAATPATAAASTSNRNAAVIVLCYHRFEDLPKDYLAIKPDEFEQQMQGLKDSGFTVIPMQDFLAWRRGEKEIPAKSAIITIDDGYLSGYDVAWPILKKFGYPFTMFVYVDYIGSGGKSITWDQLAEMRDAGVDIECHTYSHQNLHGKGLRGKPAELLKQLGYDGWLHHEIVDSKQALEKQLGIKVSVFAYPYGVYNAKAREMVKEAGYEAAFTVYGQRVAYSAPYDLMGRYAINSKEPKIFQMAMNMEGGGLGAPAAAPAVAQIAAASMATQPMQGETISDPKPVIKANLATMGAVEPNSVEMRVSGFGLVPAKYDERTKIVSFQPTSQPLRDKNYTVIVSAKVAGKRAETRWDFNFDPNAAGSGNSSSTNNPPPVGASPAAVAAPAKR